MRDKIPNAAESLREANISQIKTATSLAIVPGVAFDKDQNRIGYGKGFYDRFLQKHPDLPTVALAYTCQLTKTPISALATDIKPDIIITEENIVI
jgi:5-formyltetrahydrofolate cyclo-ligase